jgi:glycosyltransferase involved in cell wall biosynthesis
VQCSVINITRHRQPDADDVYYPNGAVQLIGLLSRLRYDVLHLHIGGMLSNRLLSLALVCTLRPDVKSVMTFHSGGFPSTPEGQALRPFSFAGFVLRRFSGLIGVNDEIMDFFRKLGVRPNRARLISPYAFLADEESAESLSAPLVSFFATHDPVLLSVGLLEPEYDLPLQIGALPHIRQKYPNAGVLMIGSGSLEADLRSRIQASPCSEHLLLPGDVPHSAVMQAISRARLMLRTTLYDGDALSVREALQFGTPVIATDNGMRPAGVSLIPKSDLPALLHAVDQELSQRLPSKAQRPSDDTNIQAVFDFYQYLLNRKG